MGERSREVRVYLVEYRCDECGSLMEFTGRMLPSLPPLYEHRCRNNHTISLSRSYPTTDYSDRGDDD